MQITINKQIFQDGLNAVTLAVSSRATLPVLSTVMLEVVAPDLLNLSATNLEYGIFKQIKCQSGEMGGICAPAKLLVDIVATMQSSDLSIVTDDKRSTLVIEGGGSRTEIKGLPTSEFPPQPSHALGGGQVAETTLRRLIAQTEFSASRDEARPILQGISIVSENGRMTFASTDGFRISIASELCDQVIPRVIVPADSLRKAAKLLNGDTYIRQELGRILFTGKDWMLFSQMVDGSFPDYNAIMPKSFKTCATVGRSDLLLAVKRASLLADGKPVLLRIQNDDGGKNIIEISATSEETGETRTEYDCTVTGPGQHIAFNSVFLSQVLGVLSGSLIVLEINDGKMPARISVPEQADLYQYVAMPMSLG